MLLWDGLVFERFFQPLPPLAPLPVLGHQVGVVVLQRQLGLGRLVQGVTAKVQLLTTLSLLLLLVLLLALSCLAPVGGCHGGVGGGGRSGRGSQGHLPLFSHRQVFALEIHLSIFDVFQKQNKQAFFQGALGWQKFQDSR